MVCQFSNDGFSELHIVKQLSVLVEEPTVNRRNLQGLSDKVLTYKERTLRRNDASPHLSGMVLL